MSFGILCSSLVHVKNIGDSGLELLLSGVWWLIPVTRV